MTNQSESNNALACSSLKASGRQAQPSLSAPSWTLMLSLDWYFVSLFTAMNVLFAYYRLAACL
jgi:hypothetical protein